MKLYICRPKCKKWSLRLTAKQDFKSVLEFRVDVCSSSLVSEVQRGRKLTRLRICGALSPRPSAVYEALKHADILPLHGRTSSKSAEP